MSDPRLLLSNPQSIARSTPPRLLGRQLIEDGHISARDLVHALDLQRKFDAKLGDILVADGIIDTDILLDALARQADAQRIDIKRDPPKLGMAKELPAAVCVQYQVVPWLWIGDTLFVATSRPAQFDQMRILMAKADLTILPVIADPNQIREEITRLYGYQLAQKAITYVSSRESCRSWGKSKALKSKFTFALGICALAAIMFFAHWALTLAILWATATLALIVGVKAAGFIAQIMHKTPETSLQPVNLEAKFRLPRVSVMVPLLREQEIASALIKRLQKLTYPKSLLDVVLVLEAADTITRTTIAHTDLPNWISVVEVPDVDGPTTKPRALNYALDFCRGSIIGVWDAEDAPEPDQIEKVVARFQDAPENVVCLQGILDYYNSRDNWISRCFTIEYATWWRLVLPGISKLGLVIPLGGTTLFFKREPLEKLGRWDAHNVTEDADLGVRLARHGYITELIPTVTYEEANCRPWRWVRQRSRWLKGFMITYIVHMKDPIRLIRELGFKRFLGLQMIFLATFSQFALAPVLWSFWITLFGATHPVQNILGENVITAFIFLFFLSEILSITMGLVAISSQRHLMKWIITMPIYFMLGTLASYKALYEMVVTPFYWDKTDHGVNKK